MAKTKATMRLYQTYQFRDKDPIIDKLRTLVQDTGATHYDIASDSGVSMRTLAKWFTGATKRPQFATVNAVARALGKDLALVDRKDMTQRKVHELKRMKATLHAINEVRPGL